MPANPPLSPNWASGVRETLEYRTEVYVSTSGKEQRRAQRDNPRRTIDFTPLLPFGQHRVIADLKLALAASTITIGDFSQPQATLRDAATAGGVNLYVQHHEAFPLLPGEYVITHAGQCEWVVVLPAELVQPFDASFSSEFTNQALKKVALLAPLERSWPAGSPIYPSVEGRFGAQSTFSFITNNISTFPLSFSCLPGVAPVGATFDPVETVNGVEVLTARPNWAAGVKQSFTTPIDMVDYGVGITAAYYPIEFPTRTVEFTYLGRGIEEAHQIRSTFIRAKGRRGEFYAPSWTEDLLPAAGILSGSDKLRVLGSPVEDAVHRGVMIVLNDGRTFPRAVTAIEESEPGVGEAVPVEFSSAYDGGFEDGYTGQTMLTLNESLPVTIQRKDIAMICWMPLSRFATDNLTIEWVTSDVAQIVINVMSVETPTDTGG